MNGEGLICRSFFCGSKFLPCTLQAVGCADAVHRFCGEDEQFASRNSFSDFAKEFWIRAFVVQIQNSGIQRTPLFKDRVAAISDVCREIGTEHPHQKVILPFMRVQDNRWGQTDAW